jgi:glycosyltransferase involved in cell wall biosynthesis
LKKQIVFISYNYWPPDFGGELLLSIERFHALAERGFDITVLTSGRFGFPKQHVDHRLKVYRSPLVGVSHAARLLRRQVFFLWTIWRLIRLPMNVVHIGDLPGIDSVTSALAVWTWAFLARIRRAYSVSVHSLADSSTTPFNTRGWEGWWRSSQFRVIDKIVSNSPALQQSVELVLPGKSELIVNGVRDDYFCQIGETSRQSLRAQAGVFCDDDVIFTFEGSVGLRKGFDTLAEAFAELVSTHPGWRLWVIGPYTHAESQNIDPKEVVVVTQKITGLESQVTFWGRVDDRLRSRDLLCASDVFVFPSRREGLGVAPLEAMATGLPVIISRIPGVTDLANVEGQTGLFIESGDSHGLRQAMLQLGEAPDLRRKMGSNARQRILELFNWTSYLRKWELLYTEFIKP